MHFDPDETDKRCPLCGSSAAHTFFTDEGSRRAPRQWRYLHCDGCDLIFRDPASLFQPEDERSHYQNHQNHPSDPRYLRFLQPALDQVVSRVEPGARGLDFGCGPGPALAAELEARGFHMAKWDPFFFAEPEPFDDVFDFITCTEVIEHFRNPGREFTRLTQMLRPGGILVVQTQLHAGAEHFGLWAYRQDATHISFYSRSTLEWIARRFTLRLSVPSAGVACFERLSG